MLTFYSPEMNKRFGTSVGFCCNPDPVAKHGELSDRIDLVHAEVKLVQLSREERERNNAMRTVLYPSLKAEDQGKGMGDIISSRHPVAMYNHGNRMLTSLLDGSQKKIPIVHMPLFNLEIPCPAININEYHELVFMNVETALLFLQENYPGLHYLPEDKY